MCVSAFAEIVLRASEIPAVIGAVLLDVFFSQAALQEEMLEPQGTPVR